MKKQLLTAVAIMVSAFFAGTMIAQAASVEIGGQLRPRFEYNEQHNFNSRFTTSNPTPRQTDGDYFVSSRIRLHAKADILPDTSAFIQLQSVRNWGNDIEDISGLNVPATCAGPGGGCTSGGSGNASFSASDNDNTVGVHQAYFTLKNFATLPVDLQVGRQEVVLDGHRILGNTGWTQGAQTHDAARLTHHSGNLTLAYVYIISNEGARGTGASSNDSTDIETHVIYGNLQGILGGALSLYFVALDDGCSAGGAGTANPGGCLSGAGGTGGVAGSILDNNLYTIGARQAGQLYGIDYRVEFYYQFGDAEGDAINVNGAAPGIGGTSGTPYSTVGATASSGLAKTSIDRGAYMLGARVGKKFTSVMWKPGITLWFDYLSGTSDEDARD
ncbi:MAG: alginate export family protein, partial [Nitrospinaceae bacterium]